MFSLKLQYRYTFREKNAKYKVALFFSIRNNDTNLILIQRSRVKYYINSRSEFSGDKFYFFQQVFTSQYMSLVKSLYFWWHFEGRCPKNPNVDNEVKRITQSKHKNNKSSRAMYASNKWPSNVQPFSGTALQIGIESDDRSVWHQLKYFLIFSPSSNHYKSDLAYIQSNISKIK